VGGPASPPGPPFFAAAGRPRPEDIRMAFKTNYNQQRGDRDRAKRQKQQEKLRKREEDTARRKAARGEGPPPPDAGPEAADPAAPAKPEVV
jgi:hypothetical protein